MSTNNTIKVDLGEQENTCFVVMPFEPLFNAEYESSIRPVIESIGLKCVRADEVYKKTRVVDDIWRCVRSCRVVLAELSGRNPNVLYEVGLAHAIGKPVIIITREEDDVPFDLRALRYLFYDTNDPFWGNNLQKALKIMVGNVLESIGVGQYLEGIISENEISYPLLTSKTSGKEEPIVPLRDVSGIWQVSFGLTGEEAEKLSGLMNMQQEGRELSATMTVTFKREEGICIVQETFSGSLDEDRVHLRGVNYFWVERLEEKRYYLDNFEVKLSSNGKSMSGKVLSRDGKGEASFRKVEKEKEEPKK